MFVFPQGSASKIIPLAIKDSTSTTGGYKTGLVAANFAVSYSRPDQGNNGATVVTLSAGTRGTWSSGGIVEKDAANAKGAYELGLPNAALAAGSDWCLVTVQDSGSNGIAEQQILIMLADAAKGLGAPSNLDAAISTRSTYAGGAVASVTAAVTVGAYSAGEDPASLVLATPANKLATDGSGRVTAGTVSDKTGYALTAAEHTAITGDVWNGTRASYMTAGSFGQGVASVQGNVTGSVASVTGSVGSVAGAVGSVTGTVGSVTGNVGGSVVGSVASVTGAVGSVTGNVGGSVASVTGAVGSVTGNVGGNVVGSIGSLAAQAKTDAFTAIWTTQLTESYAALHAVPTPAQLAFETRMLLAEKSVAGATVTGKKIDGATTAETFTLSDPTSPTSITRAS